jgi:hypothetical protein
MRIDKVNDQRAGLPVPAVARADLSEILGIGVWNSSLSIGSALQTSPYSTQCSVLTAHSVVALWQNLVPACTE